MNRAVLWAGVVAASGTTCAMASDFNAPGFYVGAAAVQADAVYTELGASDQTHTGWKVMAGLQPLPFLGAEIEYNDLGSAGFSRDPDATLSGTWRDRSTGFFAAICLCRCRTSRSSPSSAGSGLTRRLMVS
jgi:opacity protein-like surface antigen